MQNQDDNERSFSHAVKEALASVLPPAYVVREGKSILYKIEVNALGKVTPDSIDSPVRGQYAFETDILIEKKEPSIPLVVLELKYKSFSSHNVILYSSNALRHKAIYPYLRYGFVVGGVPALTRRFVTHNEGFDFAMALPDKADAKSRRFIDLINRQIASAERLAEIMQSDRINLISYEETVDITPVSTT